MFGKERVSQPPENGVNIYDKLVVALKKPEVRGLFGNGNGKSPLRPYDLIMMDPNKVFLATVAAGMHPDYKPTKEEQPIVDLFKAVFLQEAGSTANGQTENGQPSVDHWAGRNRVHGERVRNNHKRPIYKGPGRYSGHGP